MNYIDILIILIIGFFILLGYRRGLVRTVFGVASVIVALIITALAITPFTNYMNTTKFSDTVKEKVYYAIIEKNEQQVQQQSDDVDEVTDSLGLPGFIEDKIIEQGKEIINEAKISAQKAVAEAAAQTVFNALCSVILYILVILFINIIKTILTMIAKLPVIRTIDHLAGGAVGALNGIIIVYILLALLMPVVSMGNLPEVAQEVAKSSIGSVMYDNNILFNLISR